MWIAKPAVQVTILPRHDHYSFSSVLNATHGHTVALGFVQINPNLVEIQAA